MAWWGPLLVNAVVLSMLLTPLVMRRLPAWLSQKRFPVPDIDAETIQRLSNQGEGGVKRAIIAGYGPIGRNLSRILTQQGVACTVIEMNAKTVKRLDAIGMPAVFGDASHADVLEAAGVQEAQLIALTHPDVRNVELALQQARRLNPSIYALARSRYAPPVQRLRQVGASAVIYEEFESSLSFAFLSLSALGFPREITASLIAQLRQRSDPQAADPFADDAPSAAGRLSIFADAQIEWLTLADGSPLAGKTLAESAIRGETGANILAHLDASGAFQQSPDPQTCLKPGDILVAMGAPEQLKTLESLIAPA